MPAPRSCEGARGEVAASREQLTKEGPGHLIKNKDTPLIEDKNLRIIYLNVPYSKTQAADNIFRDIIDENPKLYDILFAII